eukprot:COSAG02_NODE_250_length_27076_cov_24.440618_14_plen_84_part_00
MALGIVLKRLGGAGQDADDAGPRPSDRCVLNASLCGGGVEGGEGKEGKEGVGVGVGGWGGGGCDVWFGGVGGDGTGGDGMEGG